MGKIRLLLALSVVAAHCGAIWKFDMLGGKDAVQAFYIISGFYMSVILNEKYVGQNKAYNLFITNRYLRLAPVYWAVLVFTIAICLTIGVMTHWNTFPVIVNYKLAHANVSAVACGILTNLLIYGQDIAMFLGINPVSGKMFFTANFFAEQYPGYKFLLIPAAWTLGLEFSFYLIAPFIVRRKLMPVLLLMALSLGLRLVAYYHYGLTKDPWTYRFFPAELFFFLLGYLAYRLYVRVKGQRVSRVFNVILLGFMLLLTLFYSFLPAWHPGYLPFAVRQIFYCSMLTLTLPYLFSFSKKNELDRVIGELSYPVYLSHLSVIMLVSTPHLLFLNRSWIIVLITLAVAYLLNKYVAAPVERYRQKRVKPQEPAIIPSTAF